MKSGFIICTIGCMLFALGALGCEGKGKVPPDAAEDQLVVRVYDDGIPAAGETVVVHEPDGTPLRTVITEDDGSVLVSVPADGMVTVARHETDLFTFVGVQPGDELVVGNPDAPPERELVTIADVSAPGPFAGASDYLVHLGCILDVVPEPNQPTQIPVYWPCVSNTGMFSLVYFALGMNGDEDLLAYTYEKNIPAVVGGTTSVVLPAWSSNWDVLTVNVVDAPAHIETVNVTTSYMVGGVMFPWLGEQSITSFPGSASLPWPADLADRLQLGMQAISDRVDSRWNSQGIVRQYAAVPVQVDVNLGQELPPRIRGMDLDTNAEPHRPVLSWQPNAVLAGYDGAVARLDWEEVEGPAITIHKWEILLPPDAETLFRFPELPADLAQYRPTQASYHTAFNLAFIDISYITGYAELRNEFGFDILRKIEKHYLETGSAAIIRTSRAYLGASDL